MGAGNEPLDIDRVRGERRETTEDAGAQERANQPLSAPYVGAQNHQYSDQRAAENVDRQCARREGPCGGWPLLSDQVSRAGTDRPTKGDDREDGDVLASATTRSALAQIDVDIHVGVDRLAGLGICGLLFGHWHGLHTWTGSRGSQTPRGLQVGTVGHLSRGDGLGTASPTAGATAESLHMRPVVCGGMTGVGTVTLCCIRVNAFPRESTRSS